jgi:hypothetical protein
VASNTLAAAAHGNLLAFMARSAFGKRYIMSFLVARNHGRQLIEMLVVRAPRRIIGRRAGSEQLAAHAALETREGERVKWRRLTSRYTGHGFAPRPACVLASRQLLGLGFIRRAVAT